MSNNGMRKSILYMNIRQIIESGSQNDLFELSWLSEQYYYEVINYLDNIFGVSDLESFDDVFSMVDDITHSVSINYIEIISKDVSLSTQNKLLKSLGEKSNTYDFIYRLFDLVIPVYIALKTEQRNQSLDVNEPISNMMPNGYILNNIHEYLPLSIIFVPNRLYAYNLSDFVVSEDFKDAPVISLLQDDLSYKQVSVEEFHFISTLETRLALKYFVVYLDTLIRHLGIEQLFKVFIRVGQSAIENYINNLAYNSDDIKESNYYIINNDIQDKLRQIIQLDDQLKDKLDEFISFFDTIYEKDIVKKVTNYVSEKIGVDTPKDYFSRILYLKT